MLKFFSYRVPAYRIGRFSSACINSSPSYFISTQHIPTSATLNSNVQYACFKTSAFRLNANNIFATTTEAQKQYEPKNFMYVNNYEQFQSFVSPPEGTQDPNMEARIYAVLYMAKFSTPSKQIFSSFLKMAESNPNATFIAVDVDECPRAGYYADISSVPSILVTYQDDAYKKLISPQEYSNYDNIIPDTQTALETFYNTKDKSVFRSKHTWYTHNIGLDNLNLQKVGWPMS